MNENTSRPSRPRPKLEVGKEYTTVGGIKVTICERRPELPDRVEFSAMSEHGPMSYSRTGLACVGIPEWNIQLAAGTPEPASEYVETIATEAADAMEFKAGQTVPTNTGDAQAGSIMPWYERRSPDDVQKIIAGQQHDMQMESAEAERNERSLITTFSAIRHIAAALMFVLLGIAAIVFSARAEARDLLWMPNQAGGEIVLTDVTSPGCKAGMHMAFGRSGSGDLITGCWAYSESGYVLVRWDVGSTKVFKLTDFLTFDEPDRQSTGTHAGADIRL